MLTKLTKVKLIVFASITFVALTVTALQYVRLPQLVGIGRYDISVELDNAGGLYPQAVVTYRGVEVGKVTEVGLGKNGRVIATLQVDNDVKLPRASTAQVRSSSVIGEQYVNFLPPESAVTNDYLADGAVVPTERTVIPTTTHTLLTSVDGLLKSIPQQDLRTVVNELGVALDGAGGDLGQLIDSNATLLQAATQNLPQTVQLIEDSVSVLQTQQELDPEIRSFARSLNSVSGQLVASDADLRGILASSAPFMSQVASIADSLDGVLPGMLSELANLGQVLRIYVPGIEHVLSIAPAVLPMVLAAVPVAERDGPNPAVGVWLKAGTDPPACTQGYEFADKIRNPADSSPASAPKNSFCKVATTDPRAPRGARNAPCPNGGTGATAALCGLVFDRPVVSASSSSPAASGSTASEAMLELDARMLLFDSAAPSPRSWQALLKGLVTS